MRPKDLIQNRRCELRKFQRAISKPLRTFQRIMENESCKMDGYGILQVWIKTFDVVCTVHLIAMC